MLYKKGRRKPQYREKITKPNNLDNESTTPNREKLKKRHSQKVAVHLHAGYRAEVSRQDVLAIEMNNVPNLGRWSRHEYYYNIIIIITFIVLTFSGTELKSASKHNH